MDEERTMDTPQQRGIEIIEIADVNVPEGRRPPKALDDFVVSIREIGLLHPITVLRAHDHDQTGAYRLVAGHNRLKACARLGWTWIPANIVNLEPLEAEIAEIDENLIRQALDVLERADHLLRRKKAYESLWPATKQGGRPGKAGGGKHPKDPGRK